MLSLTLFVLANCASYFVLSNTPSVAAWNLPEPVFCWHEQIGFPFEIYYFSWGSQAGGLFRCSWINSIGNVVVASSASYLFATRLAQSVPPIWRTQNRAFRYSMRSLLMLMGLACVLLGIGSFSRYWGLVVRNLVCLAGPICIFAWLCYRHNLSWLRLILAALGLTIIAISLDARYQEPAIDSQLKTKAFRPIQGEDDLDMLWQSVTARTVVAITAIRTIVPVFGILSLLVIVQVFAEQMILYYKGAEAFDDNRS